MARADKTDIAAQIAARACSQIGVRYHMHGRLPGEALDCAGLVGYALHPILGGIAVPSDYSLRGDFRQKIDQFFASIPARMLTAHTAPIAGDIALFAPGPGQQHLAVIVGGGIIHAHAGLRKIVFTPFPLQWTIIALWRTKDY
jgi:cell wall-associated NlpC family hydrolase